MVEGPSGYLKVISKDRRPTYEPSKRRLTWQNGTMATIYSDEEPDQLRGFSGDTAWLDELAKFKNPELCWSNLTFGMREVGTGVRRLITTTPRPLAILKKIEGLPGTVTVTGSSYENRANLAPEWFTENISEYEGTRTGRQEIYGEYVEEVIGALFTREAMDRVKVRPEHCPEFTTTIVAIDPAGTRDEDKDAPEKRPKNDEIGIVVASLGTDNRVYLREDISIRGGPETWGKRAIAAYHLYMADHIVAETNYGGDMVSYVIRSTDENIPVKIVTASRAKHIRAEPVSALYDPKRDGVRHIGAFSELEDQLSMFTTLGYEGPRSPDRADAWIWAVTDLALGSGAIGWLEYARRLSVAASEEEEKKKRPQWGYLNSSNAGKRFSFRVPEGTTTYYGRDGTRYTVNSERLIEVSEEDVPILIRIGWEKV